MPVESLSREEKNDDDEDDERMPSDIVGGIRPAEPGLHCPGFPRSVGEGLLKKWGDVRGSAVRRRSQKQNVHEGDTAMAVRATS